MSTASVFPFSTRYHDPVTLRPDTVLPDMAAKAQTSDRGLIRLTQREHVIILTPTELDALTALVKGNDHG